MLKWDIYQPLEGAPLLWTNAAENPGLTKRKDRKGIDAEDPFLCSRSKSHVLCWLVVWNINFIFPFILGCSSSQWTNSNLFQRGSNQPPTSMSLRKILKLMERTDFNPSMTIMDHPPDKESQRITLVERKVIVHPCPSPGWHG